MLRRSLIRQTLSFLFLILGLVRTLPGALLYAFGEATPAARTRTP